MTASCDQTMGDVIILRYYDAKHGMAELLSQPNNVDGEGKSGKKGVTLCYHFLGIEYQLCYTTQLV